MKKNIIKTISSALVLIATINTVSFANGYYTRQTFASEIKHEHFNIMSSYYSTQRWSDVINSYVYSNNNGTFSLLREVNKSIFVDTYALDSFDLVKSEQLYFELEKFGGFYAGEQYNYLVFGQDNTEYDDNKEVIRVVKYDKQYNRVGDCSLSDCYTAYPFEAGSLRMAESANELTIHTARKRYDGHQSQLTFTIDTDTMTITTKNVGEFQANHVSHSFNQFVKYDGEEHVLIDHGDAYPRSVVLSKPYGRSYQEIDLFNIPGSTGANCTGVTVGGFELSDNNYIVAINSIDHSKVTSFTSFDMNGLDVDERDVVLLILSRNNEESVDVNHIYLTDYVDNGKLASTPYLVKIPGNNFVVMWEEYLANGTFNGLKYVYIDENGNMLSDVQNESTMRLSQDCQPQYIDGKIIWFADDYTTRNIYSITVVGDLIKNTLHTDITAKINGYDIPSFNIDGYTGIVAEDLANYGFDVIWDANTKSLFIERNLEKQVFSSYTKTPVEPYLIGTKAHDILYTDIQTYVNGNKVTGYNINGYTIIYMDSLSDFGTITYDNSIRQIDLNLK